MNQRHVSSCAGFSDPDNSILRSNRAKRHIIICNYFNADSQGWGLPVTAVTETFLNNNSGLNLTIDKAGSGVCTGKTGG
jgi:hypothetical protein